MDLAKISRNTAVALSQRARQVWIAVNPKAGSGTKGHLVSQLADQLRARNFEVKLMSDVDQLAEQSQQSWNTGTLRAVVAAGGDGTVGHVVNRLASGIPLCVLPLGTENLLAKYLQLPADTTSLAEIIEQGCTVHLDAGSANGRLFLLMLSCGLDADVVRRVHSQRRGNITHIAYAKPILESLRTYKYPKLTIRVEGHDEELHPLPKEIECRWIFVVNLPRYARGLQLMPDAVGTDGMLDICAFLGGNWWNSLRYLGGVLVGQHRQWTDCQTFQTSRLHIAADSEVPYQIDGDPGGVLPVDIEIFPAHVTCVVSSSWAQDNGFAFQEMTL